MLDLMTLGASMGLQKELTNVRKEMGESPFQEEAPAQAEETTMSSAADTIGDSLQTVENAVCSAAQSMIPSWEMVQNAMPSVMPTAPVIDLTLPTRPAGKKA